MPTTPKMSLHLTQLHFSALLGVPSLTNPGPSATPGRRLKGKGTPKRRNTFRLLNMYFKFLQAGLVENQSRSFFLETELPAK
jgi:hypothetical protein